MNEFDGQKFFALLAIVFAAMAFGAVFFGGHP